jgi:DNA-binding NarL/FixJ family response regulator
VRVAIAEDSGLIREAMTLLLRSIDVEVGAAVGTGAELLAVIRDDPPDVVIVDMRMPPTRTNEGLLTARLVKAAHPATGVLVVTAHDDSDLAADLLADGTAGVGYLRKDSIANKAALKDALARVAAGEPVIDSHIAARLLARGPQPDRLDVLTDRERLILELMAQGLSNAGIAKRVYLSTKTVEAHTAGIFTKLGLRAESADNKRVLAVLAWLRSGQPSRQD